MFACSPRRLAVAAPMILAVCAAYAHAVQPGSRGPLYPLVIDNLGLSAAPLDGPWQFHLGDNPAWAEPAFDDSQWEQLTADETWGMQGHANYAGYAWYRRKINLSAAPGASPDFALLIPAIDGIYELYWNGMLVGRLGNMPPHMLVYSSVPAQTFGLGPVRSGVLAVRVFKLPLGTTDTGAGGGFEGTPIMGGTGAIAAA